MTFDTLSGDLATKSDLIEVKAEIKAEIAGVKSDLEKQIARLEGKFNLLFWMVGFVLAISLIILGKLLILRP